MTPLAAPPTSSCRRGVGGKEANLRERSRAAAGHSPRDGAPGDAHEDWRVLADVATAAGITPVMPMRAPVRAAIAAAMGGAPASLGDHRGERSEADGREGLAAGVEPFGTLEVGSHVPGSRAGEGDACARARRSDARGEAGDRSQKGLEPTPMTVSSRNASKGPRIHVGEAPLRHLAGGIRSSSAHGKATVWRFLRSGSGRPACRRKNPGDACLPAVRAGPGVPWPALNRMGRRRIVVTWLKKFVLVLSSRRRFRRRVERPDAAAKATSPPSSSALPCPPAARRASR